jgi:hypothetical protein
MINLLNAELNPICHLLALLEYHHIIHVSRIRVKKIVHLVLFLTEIIIYKPKYKKRKRKMKEKLSEIYD